MNASQDIQPRLLSGKTAAAYCGVTPATFSKWVAAGTMPKAVVGRRWDRKAIDLALDKLSGIAAPSEEEDDFEAWENRATARKIAVQNRGIRQPWEDKFDAAWAEWLVEHAAWNSEQPSAKQTSPEELEQMRKSLWEVWESLKAQKSAARHDQSRH
jgi:hypothetical protein